MTTKARIGFGVVLQREGAGGLWGDVGDEILSVSPPKISVDTDEATHMKSPEGFREFIKSLKDGGEVSVSIAYIAGDADVTSAIEQINSPDASNYRVNFGVSACAFSGLAIGFEPDVPMENKMVATLTYKVTGKPVFGAIV